jgi:hypothetical protein
MNAGRRARYAFVLVVIGLLSGGSSSAASTPVAPIVSGIQLPVFQKSCAPPSRTPSVVPIRVVGGHRGAEIVANVCFGGEGPFPFVVDTGAATTLVDKSVAVRLHLLRVHGPWTVASFTCKRQVFVAAVSDWSVGSMKLPPQAVLVGTIQSPVVPNLDGLIGSDTLSRFGAVRIDFRQQTITLGRQSAPLRSDVAGGSRPPSVPASLREGTSFASPMPVEVIGKALPHELRLTEVRPTVDLSFGPERFTLTLDTGAATTVLGPSVVKELRLVSQGVPLTTYAGLACPVVVNRYTLGPATLGKVQLSEQPIGSSFIPPGTVGVLGSGTLIRYNPVLVDYTDGELFLGPGATPQSASPEPPVPSGPVPGSAPAA